MAYLILSAKFIPSCGNKNILVVQIEQKYLEFLKNTIKIELTLTEFKQLFLFWGERYPKGDRKT